MEDSSRNEAGQRKRRMRAREEERTRENKGGQQNTRGDCSSQWGGVRNHQKGWNVSRT